MKQWQSMWMQDLGLLLVNCCIAYIAYLEVNNVLKKNILLECDFRKAIALAQLDSKNYWRSNDKKILTDEISNLSGIAEISRKKIKRKSACITDDSFSPNSNINDYLCRFVEHEFELCSKFSRCAMRRQATDRKVSKCNDVHFVHLIMSAFACLITNYCGMKRIFLI